MIRVKGFTAILGTAGVLLMGPMSTEVSKASSEFLMHPFVNVTGSCVDCTVCGPSGHHTYNPDIFEPHFAEGHGYHLLCEGEPDCLDHGVCGGFAAAVEGRSNHNSSSTLDATLNAVRVALLMDDLTALDQILEEDTSVVFNSGRSAVQVLGCGDQVVAHFRLSDSQVIVLTD